MRSYHQHDSTRGGNIMEGQNYDGPDRDTNWRRPTTTQNYGGESSRQGRGHRHPNNHYQRGRGVSRLGGRQLTSSTEGPIPTRAPTQGASKIIGVCREMCPARETLLREREGLLHKFEVFEYPTSSSQWPVETTGNVGPCEILRGGRNGRRGDGGKGNRKPLPKADSKRTIKSFARSAAGQDKTLPEDLRPANILKETVKYLCEDILPRTDCPFNIVYDFMFDRLRAIRQDMVIQRIEDNDAIKILETIVRFHIYAEFRLREEHISVYDPHINQKHLVDCLRKLLVLYEFNNYKDSSRHEFEALNCLVSINSYQVVARAYSIRTEMNSNVLNASIGMALAYQCKNFVGFFRKIGQLPCILQMYCERHVAVMRQFAFHIMCIAYGVRDSCKIPLSWITSQLLYSSNDETHADLGQLNVEIIRDNVTNEKFVKFKKSQATVMQSATGIKHKFHSLSIQSIVQDGTLFKLCLSL